jgi:hypothetical protein
MFIAKYNSTGALAWARRAGGLGYDEGFGITLDASAGTSYVVGYFEGSATFGLGQANQTVLTASGINDMFIAKYNSNGVLLWAKRAGGSGFVDGIGIARDDANNLYVTGSFSDAATFGAGEVNQTVLTAVGGFESFIAKYNSSGAFLWAKQTTGTGFIEGFGIAADASGNSYVIGYFDGSTTFGLTEPSPVALTSVGGFDLFVAKYRTNGSLAWAKRAGGTGFDVGSGIAVDTSGNSYVTGYFDGVATFGSGEGKQSVLQSAGGYDIFVAKLAERKAERDFDGDGKTDLIIRGANNTFRVSRSSGAGFSTPELWLQHGGEYLDGQAQFADLNGDGKMDMIYQGTDNSFWVSLSTGVAFTSPTRWIKHGGWYLRGQAQYADVNGDGKVDLVMQGIDNSFWVSLSTGTSFASPSRWIDHGGWYLEGQAQYADLDGDGKADMIFQGLDNAFWVSLSTGVGFTSPALWVDHGGTYLPGQAQYADLNGDGKADLVLQGGDNSFWVSLSTGAGFTSPTLWIDHGGMYLPDRAQYADLNGDGRADLVLQGEDNSFWVSLSTGVGFTSPALWADHGGVYLPGQAQYVDVNGDGNADLVMQGTVNSFWVNLSTGDKFTAPQLWLSF